MRVALGCWLVAGVGLLFGAEAESGRKSDAEAELAYHEKLLKDSGVGTDGPGLLAFFRSRTLSEGDHERLKKAVRRLGDNEFAVREKATLDLVGAGRFALPLLRPALEDRDLEIARRAERCIEDIERAPYTSLLTAAASLTAQRRPAGASEVILACLPWVDDEPAEEALFRALAATGLKGGVADSAVLAAATDKEAIRRAAAAHVLGQAGTEHRRQAQRLLDDSDVRVRFQAATMLARSGERSALPVLTALLTDAPLSLAWQVEDLLCRIAGDKMPQISPGSWDEASRKKCRGSWEAWWKENESKIDLARVNLEDIYLGLNLIAELDGSGRNGSGRVWECGLDGKPRWQFDVANRPIDAQMVPGGRILVAEHGQSRVTERDREGKVLWEQRVDNQPVSVQRLSNGNTFIATYNELLEVTPANKVVYSSKRPGMIYNAQKLRDGHMVFVQSNNQVIELDAAGKEVRTVNVANTGGWASAERLPNMNYLVALYSSRKVVEVDMTGKVVWEVTVEMPGYAQRLRNGNTLVTSIEGRKMIEFDRAGKEVWSQATQGRPFHARRR
jgi:outer membrane protein assembly factor BamB